MIDEQKLNFELEKIKELLKKREYKYFHIESIENFIYHLKSIQNERTRERMAILIDEYISLASEKMYEPSTEHDKYKELFPSIWKLYFTYKDEVGFIRKPNFIGILMWLIPMFAIEIFTGYIAGFDS